MRLFHTELLHTTVQPTPTYSLPQHSALLGSADRLVFQFTSSRSTGGRLVVQIEHSSDGENWVEGLFLINDDVSSSDITVLNATYDAVSDPLLAFVRLRCEMYISGDANLQIFATGYGCSERAGEPACRPKFVEKIFDGQALYGPLYVSDTHFNELLATVETSLVLQVVAARMTEDARMALYTQTSMDGQDWSEVTLLDPDRAFSTTDVNNLVYLDTRVRLYGPLVRLAFYFTYSSPESWFRIYAVGR